MFVAITLLALWIPYVPADRMKRMVDEFRYTDEERLHRLLDRFDQLNEEKGADYLLDDRPLMSLPTVEYWQELNHREELRQQAIRRENAARVQAVVARVLASIAVVLAVASTDPPRSSRTST